MRNIAIIPARGGSKGIVEKNLRFFNNRPLIYYVIQTALRCKEIDDVIITSEDENIIDYCKRFNVRIRIRPEYLSRDDVTLDPVVYDALSWFESLYYNVDNVITIQPTSPLLTVATLSSAINYFEKSDYDTLISVSDDTCLTWREQGEMFVPDYEKRVNRQWLPKRYKETGAFMITKKHTVTENSRIGNKVDIYPIPVEESIDIDSEVDWYIAEHMARKLRILFVTSANESIGMGHIYRCISLANSFIGNERFFLLLNTFAKGKQLLQENNYKYLEIESVNQVKEYSKDYDIVVNDFLDTSADYIEELADKFVVNFEDLGDGADKSNIVFNALYEFSNPKENHKFGWRYFILNEKILIRKPNDFRDKVREVLVTFGGVDQNNLTLKTLRVLERFNGLKVKIILGPGYGYRNELNEFLKVTNLDYTLLSDVKNMGKEMENIDLAITSNGRTIYELTAMNIPTVSISQNDRETMHLFSRYSKGICYLGISCNVDDETLYGSLKELIENNELRYKMYESLAKTDIRKGIKNVKSEIISSFWRWKDERDNHW